MISRAKRTSFHTRTARVPAAAGLGLTAVLLAGCAVFAPTASTEDTTQAPSTAPEPTASVQETHHADDGHGHDEFYEGIPDVSWAPETDEEVEGIATTVMGLFARPDMPEREWYTDLFPYLAEDYAVDAQYIDPARIRVSSVDSEPTLVREQGNPLTVTAEFATDAGPWVVQLHRIGQEDPWLVTAIAPKDT